ncbi:MAG: hypothetical protein IJT21_02825 [Synergistaceae bacterium]|nr:hypothetical protein [Synergistaceae bacterium]
MSNRSDSKAAIYLLLFTFLASFVMVSSSPLINLAGIDSGVFVTAGRGVASGKIMYKELFDHKALYLYFINALGALISMKSLIGIWLLEVLFMFVNAIIARKIYQQFYPDGKGDLLAAELVVLLALNPETLQGGNLTENYTLPFQFLSIYLLVKYLKSGEVKHSPLIMFVHGLNVACSMNMRPNHVLMWGPIALLILARLIYHKEYKNILQNLLSGLAGVFVGCLPAIYYAVANDAVYDVLFGTFLYNFLYIGVNPHGFVYNFFLSIFVCPHVLLVMIPLLISCFIVYFRKNIYNRLYYFFILFGACCMVSVSGYRMGHYYEYLVPFALPIVFEIANFITAKNFTGKFQTAMIALIIIYTGLTYMTLHDMFPGHKSNRVKTRESHAAIFAANRKYYGDDVSNEKVISISGGSYIAIGVIPHQKYYYTPANPYEAFPDAVDAQAKSILSGENDVIFWGKYTESIFAPTGKLDEIKNVLATSYDIILEGSQIYGKKK